MKRILALTAAAALAALSTIAPAAHAAEVRGAGSTFAYPIIWKWAEVFRERTGTLVEYQSVGSSAGVNRLKDGVVDFGASDRPLKPEELEKYGLGQFPIVFGGVVPVFNLEGVKPGQIRFTGALLADIYLGKVATWSDPAIKALNPEVKLPDAKIVVVHRSDGSGTTFNWVSYLAKASPDWKRQVGEGSSVAWPVGTGARGNEGVSSEVKRVPNSIGYVEYTYVVQAKLAYGTVQNRSGKFVAPSAASFQAAALSFDWAAAKDFFVVINDSAAEDAYPIAATTFALMYREPKVPASGQAAFAFWRFALGEGETFATTFGYVPLPPALVQQVKDYWAKTFKGGV
ncbi:phosphate ABC transporter substrate-binding protein PstS [Aquabacter spiritensis]|uniref:Phosphate-binding protein PstS n=1 Tax=Aquabacter spiritensis TaxID=933073 RepID=A0A4V2UWV1_9HYPH|nr:phosphate ABC transporter substrate-binding protein PstS [Aquabacter spiritensis]TCT01048.1 phosphate ABC transporter substrate-binding protein (PhoT family) [Aquabacter spiritensis]